MGIFVEFEAKAYFSNTRGRKIKILGKKMKNVNLQKKPEKYLKIPSTKTTPTFTHPLTHQPKGSDKFTHTPAGDERGRAHNRTWPGQSVYTFGKKVRRQLCPSA